MQARHQQHEDKERLLAQMMAQERQEHLRIIRAQREEEERERKEAERQEKSRKAYCNEVVSQIHENEVCHRKEREAFLAEADLIRQKNNAELKMLERVKQKKIEQLKKIGVPEKYQTELCRKKIVVGDFKA